ncbi:MAG TPA: aldehyde dehydrogenase family protein [Acidimicrobiales bacterium]|nr:aldehyde dehydrogenase family protein [Acidimicrobiales bacterium]
MRTTPTTAVLVGLAERGHLVGGEWTVGASGGTFDHHEPATGRHQATVGLGGAAEIDAAVASARAAQPSWAALGPQRRAAVLVRLAELLEEGAAEAAELAAIENGTPVRILNPAAYAAAWLRHAAAWAPALDSGERPGRDVAVDLEPYGVVGAIPPWNGSMMGMGQKCGPALALGNAVVAKPPEVAPFGMLRFAELALEAGLPPGVLNVVVGGAEAGAALAGHGGVGKVSFTGSPATGRAVMAAAATQLTPVTLELGGKSPCIVFPDADLGAAAAMAARIGTALFSGQGCALPTRLYVHADVYDDVVERVRHHLGGLTVGDPLDPATVVGPVVTEAALERILGVIDRARAEGATLLAGGARLGGDLASGWFVAPTLFGHVDHDSDLARHEVFGPVQAALRFETEDEALRKANDSPYGLHAYLFTSDPTRIERFRRGLEAGTVVVNGMGRATPAAPFGGVKHSGFGREGGRAGMLDMVRTKTVHLRPG